MPNHPTPYQLPDIDARRICIIKPSALGDVIQSLPLLPVLKDRFPDSHISWVIKQELSEILSGHPGLDQILQFDQRGTFRSWMRLLVELRRSRFDLVLDLQGLLRTGVMTWVTAAPMRVGLQTAREGSHLAYNFVIPGTGREVAAHKRYWRVPQALGMGDSRPLTTVQVAAADRERVDRLFTGIEHPILTIHPGARWITKRWPVERFGVVACKAMRNYGFSVVLIGAASEQSVTAQLEQLLRKLVPRGTIANLTGKTTLKQLAVVLSQSDVVLTNDSGPMHLAAGLGTPVLATFTCTHPERSGPPGDQHELVATNVPCAASYKKRCPQSGKRHLACMDELSTERVCQALDRLAEKNRIKRMATGESSAA